MMTIHLVHAPNPDISGGYWQEPIDPRILKVTVDDIGAAVAAFKVWRDRNGLGGGNTTRRSGLVTMDGKPLARVRYNGTVEYLTEAADYEARIRALEAEGLTRSDAQAVVDAAIAKARGE